MEPSPWVGPLTHDYGWSEKTLVLRVKPSSKEQSAGQGLRLWGFIFMQSHGWAKLQPSQRGSGRSRAGTGPCPSLPGPGAVTSAFPWHSRTSWPPAGLSCGGCRGSLSHRTGSEPRVFHGMKRRCQNQSNTLQITKHPLRTAQKAGLEKFVSLVQLPGTLRIYLKCRTKSFAMQKKRAITRVGKALHGKSSNKGSVIAFQRTDV